MYNEHLIIYNRFVIDASTRSIPFEEYLPLTN